MISYVTVTQVTQLYNIKKVIESFETNNVI